MYSGSPFIASLNRDTLIDEVHLFIPAALGTGLPILNKLRNIYNMKLQK